MATRKTTRGARGRKTVTKKTKSASGSGSWKAALASLRNRVRTRLGRQSDDVWGVVVMVAAILLLLSFFGLAGPIGRGLTAAIRMLFGLWAYTIPIALGWIGVIMVGSMPKADYVKKAIGTGLVFMSTLALFHLMTGTISLAGNLDLVADRGGAVGSLLAFPLRRLIGFWGAFVVLTAITGVGVLIVTKATIRDLGLSVVGGFQAIIRRLRRRQPAQQPVTVAAPTSKPTAKTPTQARPKNGPAQSTRAPKKSKPRQPQRPIPQPPTDGKYALPPLELLDNTPTEGHNKRALEQTAADLEATLLQHGVDARLTRIVPGPTVTRYEIELSPGVKVSRVTGLAHDIAYAMASPDVRILAPIPGKSAIGIEVPNRRRQLVSLGDILTSAEATTQPHPMIVGLGKDISGSAQMLNLTELPHLIIAGATGAGKSSCINAIVTSLLMRSTPEEVRMILVDPKRVELGQYNDVPHLLTRVITNPKKASDALEWAVGEMDRRYELLADSGVRDITSYREKWDAGGIDKESFDRFPYIVIIVDELNDLMMVAGRAVEDSIVRIAQMARAVGIHLVLATQRPSVNVITGVIKANVPSRLAFSVASQTDSRVILDTVGAEKLVGLGDMLVVTARDPKPERVQGAFISEAEVRGVVAWVKDQRRTTYDETPVFAVAAKKEAVAEEFEGEDPEIIKQSIELVVRSQLGSTSMLQRKLRIGFARAGRVIDILERKGIVGPSEGSKAREVLITVEEFEAMVAETS